MTDQHAKRKFCLNIESKLLKTLHIGEDAVPRVESAVNT